MVSSGKPAAKTTQAATPKAASFKAYDARWMATTSQLAPFTESTIAPLLLTSAEAAAASCIHPGLPLNGNSDGLACAAQWTNGSTWDGTIGVGQQMSALSTILSTIIKTVPPPLTNATGGTSASNPTAGFNSSSVPPGAYIPPPTSGDRVGAWFITVVMAVLVAGMCAFMWSTAWEDKPDQVTGRGEKGKEDFRMTGAVAGARTNTAVSGGVLSAVPEHEPNHLHRKPIYLGGTVAT
jgi:mannan endo-1,6-alpha-mannosidase